MLYEKRQFILTLNGDNQPLTLKGIGTPQIVVQADASNLQPVYVGNIFDTGVNGVMQTLTAGNALDTLLAGQGQQYNSGQQDDRFERRRSWYQENNFRHIMSQWFVKGTAGDLVYVTWLDENLGPLYDTNGVLVNVEGLSR